LKESYPDTRGGPQKVLTIVVNWERIRPDRYESGEVADRPPVPKIRLRWSELHPALKELPGVSRTLVRPNPEAVVDKHDAYLEMRFKIEAVFEHYAAQSEYYKRANIAQRLVMEDSFYQLSMELLSKIIAPFEVMRWL